ncbi:MAG TPA: TonB-dependent receptor [Steroidobacteraceae bacterium]|jgi:outer membrane receptor protein involved in Fe transport|nr:TonB-dependent receptor [Steroidobacteraceae bacterium]
MNRLKGRAPAVVAGAVIFGLSTAGISAEETESLKEVVVTGSRIATPELESMTPITVLTNQAIEASGTLNISDFLRDLPSVGTSLLSTTNSNFLTSGSGVNSINLRNLGDQRTLVLVNGKRYVPGLPGSSIVDFNTIPTDFIDHIEITTGGASAVYGSDAVAGVVNVLYKTNFEGLQFRGQAGETGHHDDARYGGGLMAGAAFDEGRGHFLLDLSYDKDDGLWSRQRSRSAVDETVLGGVLVKPTYSSFAPQGRFTYTSSNGGAGDLFTFNPDGTLKQGFSSAANGFNRNAWRRISVPTDRTLIASTMNFDLAEHHQAYAEVTYGYNHTQSNIEPFALSGSTPPGAVYGNNSTIFDANGDAIGVPITNAYLQTLPVLAPVLQAINQFNSTGANCVGSAATNPAYDCISYLNFRKRLVDIAARGNEATRQTMRSLVGVKGDVPFGDWRYDVSLSYGRTTDAQFTTGQVNLANVRAALDSVVDPTSGKIVCRDPVWVSLGCVPLNIFGFNSITPAAAAWVNANVTENAKIQEQILSASIQGSVGSLPAGNPQLVIGVEQRKDSSEQFWDPLTNAGLNGGNQLPNVKGSITVKEAFVEGQVPIFKDQPGAYALNIDAALRHASYSTIGSVNTWKAGLDWAPIQDLRFRGVYSVAIRAPNIGELYGGQSETFPTGLVDPCDGITAATAGQFPGACAKVPGVAAAIANGGQFKYTFLDYQTINGFVGSNPQLKQEKAKTETIGIVLTPRALPHFNATIDYYDVKIDGAVGVVDFQTEINNCLAGGAFCDSVIRNAQSGKLQSVNQLSLNVAQIHTRGVDTVVRYGFDLGRAGGLSLQLAETHLLKLEQAVPGAPLLDNVGELNSGANGRLGSGFKDRGTLTAVYDIGPFEATWRVNYLSSINDTNPTASNTVISALYNHVPSYTYNDVQLRYTFNEKKHSSVYLGANNLFNKQPPFLPGGMASEITGTETAADTYDVFGVFLYAGVEVKM